MSNLGRILYLRLQNFVYVRLLLIFEYLPDLRLGGIIYVRIDFEFGGGEVVRFEGEEGRGVGGEIRD